MQFSKLLNARDMKVQSDNKYKHKNMNFQKEKKLCKRENCLKN